MRLSPLVVSFAMCACVAELGGGDAPDLHAGASSALVVGGSVVDSADRRLLGQAFTALRGYPLADPDLRDKVRRAGPGVTRFPHNRYQWERSGVRNAWQPQWGDRDGFSTVDGRVRAAYSEGELQASINGDLVLVHGIYQRLPVTSFTEGGTYRLRFDYQVNGYQAPPERWRRHRVLVSVFYYEDHPYWIGSTELVAVSTPTSPGTGSRERTFVYQTAPGKTPAFVQVSVEFDAAGEVFFDNVELRRGSDGVNLVTDSNFDELRLTSSPYQYRFTSADLDAYIDFTSALAIEPIFQWGALDAVIPDIDLSGPVDADELQQAILSSPQLAAAIDSELDILRYANRERGYGIVKWELMNEPEILWTWLSPRLNFGVRPADVHARYKLYGRVYALMARRALEIDPSIELVVALQWHERFRESVDGFFAGIAEHEAVTPSDDPTMPVPRPDFYAPHPYQMRAWGQSPACPAGDEATCARSLLTWAPASGPARCDTGSLSIVNEADSIGTISYFEAYMECLEATLREHGVDQPAFLPTEWEASGSTGTPYGLFANEVWTADRLGRMARLGIHQAVHWNVEHGALSSYGKVNSPYLTLALFARILGGGADVLATSTGLEGQVTVYAFLNRETAVGHVVLVNLDPDEGSHDVTLTLPDGWSSDTARALRVRCSGSDCITERGVTEINGRRFDTMSAAEILDNLPFESIALSPGTRLELPHHSLLFLEIDGASGDGGPDTSAPHPATVSAEYSAADAAVHYSWSWNGDRTCPGCEAPVGMCSADGVSTSGAPCDRVGNAPYWWQVVDVTTGERVAYSYRNDLRSGTGGADSHSTSFVIACQGRAGHRLRIDVDTRDAVGNIVGAPTFENVESASAGCPGENTDSVAPFAADAQATYDAGQNRVRFQWSWTGDRTCDGCEPPVGYCKTNGVSSAGVPCDPIWSPPFWWQVVAIADGQAQTIMYSYNNDPAHQMDVGGYASHANSVTVSCQGRSGATLRVDVDTRDARNNIVGGPSWDNVRSAKATCP